MGTGHIRIHRSIESWRWGDDPVMVYFWIRVLLMANWEDREWHDTVIKRGAFVTTLSRLSGQLNLSVKQVRTCLDRLRAGGEINTNTANNYTLVTVCKYDDYQLPAANEGQMKGKPKDKQKDSPTATTKEEYNTSDTKVSSYSIQETLFKDEEIDTSVSTKKSDIDYDYIKALWNRTMKRKVPKVQAMSDSRKEKIWLRIAEMGGWIEAEKILPECFTKINESEFCNGENDNKWVATFDWFFINDKNWIKVIEGNYDNRQRKTQLEILAENVAKADAYYERRYHGYGGASPYGNQTGSGPHGPDEQ